MVQFVLACAANGLQKKQAEVHGQNGAAGTQGQKQVQEQGQGQGGGCVCLIYIHIFIIIPSPCIIDFGDLLFSDFRLKRSAAVPTPPLEPGQCNTLKDCGPNNVCLQNRCTLVSPQGKK